MDIKWKIISEDYLSYLRSGVEQRIPLSDYGARNMKPFFGVLFETGDLSYVTQISHPQPRHVKLKNSLDFYKVFHPTDNRLIAVVNLNYMFPIPKVLLKDLEYKEIENFRIFTSPAEKSKYINLLETELKIISGFNLQDKAKLIYDLKYQNPTHAVSMRCFDFKNIEIAARDFEIR